MFRVVSVIGLAFLVPCLFGCGLFGGSKPYQFQETPPYYKAQKDEMIDQAKIHRQSELSRLERDASELESDKKGEDAFAAEKEKKKKKNLMENWFGRVDETFLMSNEAKRINANLER